MARIPLVCPLDGTSLGAANANVTPIIRAGDAEGRRDDHYHLQFAFDLSCQNGHRFQVTSADITIVKTN
jgi:hypothetical protein